MSLPPTLHHLTSRLAVALLLTLLAGCALSLDPARRASARRVGVLSLLGDKVHSDNLGITVFEGKNYDASAPDFRLDATAAQTALSGLRSANPHAEIVNLQSERNTVHLPDSNPLRLGLAGPGLGDQGPAAEDAVRRLAAKYKLDLVVLIVPRPGFRRDTNTPHKTGCGFYGATVFGDHRDIHVYANYGVGAFDGPTGKLLSFRLDSVEQKVQGLKWRTSLEAYSPSERGSIAFSTSNLLIAGVDKQLSLLGLTR